MKSFIVDIERETIFCFKVSIFKLRLSKREKNKLYIFPKITFNWLDVIFSYNLSEYTYEEGFFKREGKLFELFIPFKY